MLDSSLICSKSQFFNKLMLQAISRHLNVVPKYTAFGLVKPDMSVQECSVSLAPVWVDSIPTSSPDNTLHLGLPGQHQVKT